MSGRHTPSTRDDSLPVRASFSAWRRWGAAALCVAALACGGGSDSSGGASAVPASAEALTPIPAQEWVALVEGLSEAGGFFDTDNLISNETSYLHVLGAMKTLGVQGGAYLGVGPDQNFAYMAAQRPWLAFIVDLRRDNLIHHLLLKALFHESGTRAEYLALLFGRAAPENPEVWHDRPIEEIVAWVESSPGGEGTPEAREALDRVRQAVEGFGLPVNPTGWATLERFHRTFIQEGADLRFTSFGRAPRPFYPTFAELLAATDLEGTQGSYLARREDFLFLKALQEANRVIPVVGDLAGPTALQMVGEEVRSRGLTVRAFYTSNVEYYLWGAGTFRDFAVNLASLPMDERSVIIRSVFPNTARHPHAISGFYSTQTVVPMEEVRRVVRGNGYRDYQDLVIRGAVDPRVGGA